MDEKVEKQSGFAEVGTTGLNRFGGTVAEEFLSELQGQRGRKTYTEMALNDAIVSATLFAAEMALREVPWFARPVAGKGLEGAELLGTCMHDMSHTWRDLISEILNMLQDGFSYFEVVYKKRDGKVSKYNDGLIGWRKFGYRSWDSLLEWKFDETGGIAGFIQCAPPNYQRVEIPIEKSILFRTRKKKNNPEGLSVLRPAYRSWYFKHNLESLEGISLERTYAGFPVMKLPAGASTGSSTNSDEYKAKDVVRKIRIDEQMGVVLPNGWALELLGPEGRGIDAFNTTIMRYRGEIMISALNTFIALGIEKTGSYALARESRDFYQIALQGWLDNICETLNQYAVPKLLKLNGFDGTEAEIATGKVGQVSLEQLSNYIMRLTQIGALTPDSQLEKYLREAADLPPKLEDEVAVEVGKSEDWHPSVNPKALKELKNTEEAMERSTRRFFQRQRKWLGQNWQQLMPSKSVEKQENPADWDEWELEFAREIVKPLGNAMNTGANTARSVLPNLIVDWSLTNPKAQDFIRRHSLQLARNINDTTKESIRAVLRTGMDLGEGLDKLGERVKSVLDDASIWRSRMIAQTETINAYAEGSEQLYREANVKEKEWLDGQEGACPVCQDLDGTKVGIDEGFDAGEFGNVSHPPAHPGCRCTISGVVE